MIHLSNDPEDVPEARRTEARQFTSKFAVRLAPEGTPTIPLPPQSEPVVGNAYERGLERGLQAAEKQVALAAELARTVLAAIPQPQPQPVQIMIQQPQPVVRYVERESGWGPYSYYPYYGYIGPYAPFWPFYGYGVSYPYGFGRGRLVPHSHFFPGTRTRRRGLFFPHGHSSHHGFLFGHGFVVR